jgi:hypothetical protein
MAGTGKAMPLDAEPTVDGNIILDAMGKAYVVDADEYVNPKVARYTSHFATCPSADEFRKSRSK